MGGGQDCTGTVRIITQAQVKSLNVKEIRMIFPCLHDKPALDTDTQSSERREEGNVGALSDVGWGGRGRGVGGGWGGETEWWCTNKTMTQQLEAE